MSQEMYEKIDRSLTNQTPTEIDILYIEHFRATAKQVAVHLADLPSSRETLLAITHLEECVMWAVKSIVLNGARSGDLAVERDGDMTVVHRIDN